MTATVFRPRPAARSISPSRYTSDGEWIPKMNFRPFLKIDVVAAPVATIGMRCFSVTSAMASVIGEEYGPRIASTLSWAMSFS